MHLADTATEAKEGMGQNMGKHREINENMGKYRKIMGKYRKMMGEYRKTMEI